MAGGKFHEWKGRKQNETTGYPFDNGPPFLDPKTGDPIFPAGVTPPDPEPKDLSIEVRQDETNPLKWHFKSEGGVPPITYDFGDGKTHTPSDGRNTAHTYEAPGEYHVEASDAEDHMAETDIEVPEPEAP